MTKTQVSTKLKGREILYDYDYEAQVPEPEHTHSCMSLLQESVTGSCFFPSLFFLFPTLGV